MPVLVHVAEGTEDDRRATAEAASALVGELSRAGITVRPKLAAAPPSSKSAPSTVLETLIVYGLASPAAAAAFTKVMIAFLHRRRDRKIVIEQDGDRLELHGASAADQRAALEAWCARQEGRHTGTETD